MTTPRWSLGFTPSTVPSQASTTFKLNEAFSLSVSCETQAEVDDLCSKLTADGGSPSRCGWCKDRFGVSWQFIPDILPRLLTDPDPDRSRRAVEAMMTMQKIDIAAWSAPRRARRLRGSRDWMKKLLILVVVVICATGCKRTGTCITEYNCMVNHKQSSCEGQDELFVGQVSSEQALLVCKAFGYELKSDQERAEFEARIAADKSVGIGWTKQEIERRKAAGTCTPGGPKSCAPFKPDPARIPK